MPKRRKLPQRREPQQIPGRTTRRAERTVRHPLYGEIPLIEIVRQDAGRDEVLSVDYDRDYRPQLPAGAVRGDVYKQHFCPMCHTPRYFYVDQERTCVECGQDFVFSAHEQKFWYEELKFYFDSVAIRCQECRCKLRTKRALHGSLARAKAKLEESPADSELALAAAESIVRLAEHAGEGDLNEAIALSRKAGRSETRLQAEALFWEGRAQALLGRHDRATSLLRTALAALPTSKRGAALRAEAEWYLNEKRNGT